MTFVGKDSLHIAQFLGGQRNGPCTLESLQRAAISRAYFAAYAHAFHYEVDNGRYTPRGGVEDHKGLRVHFANVKKDQDTASKLEDLRRWRNYCDYHKIFVGSLSQNVKDALNFADVIIDRLI